MLRATNTVNNILYLDLGENTRLLAPADFITPWRTDQPGVRAIPESNLSTLKGARRKGHPGEDGSVSEGGNPNLRVRQKV